MTIDEAKAILSVWRPDGSDSTDPAFREALELARHNPELLEWLHAQQEFDLDLTDSVQAIRVPASGRKEILAQGPAILRERSIMRFVRWIGAAAVVLIACALVWQNVVRYDRVLPAEAANLAEVAEHLSVHHKSMEYFSENPHDLFSWLARRESPFPESVPSAVTDLKGYGCQDWQTRKGGVSLLCFYTDRTAETGVYDEDTEWLHLFVFEADLARTGEIGTTPRLFEGREWVFAVWRDGDKAYALGLPSKPDTPERLRALIGA